MAELCVVTPTRKRWFWLAKQAEALIPQLGPGDLWVIVVDNDEPNAELLEAIMGKLGTRAVAITLHYARPNPPVGCVNRARNIGALMSGGRDIVEVDDHDVVEPDALKHVREALDAGAHYVYGDCHSNALIQVTEGSFVQETWPDIKGPFGEEREVIGLRAMCRDAWLAIGGWGIAWPGGDQEMFHEVVDSGLCVLHLDRFLCTVLTVPDSISGMNRKPG